MIRHIESPGNATVKALARLRKRRHRDAERRYLVEGHREVGRAVDAGVVEQLLIAPELGATPPDPAPTGVLTLSAAAFAKVSVRQHPDGYAAVATPPPTDLDAIANSTAVLVAEGTEKPGNLGAMLRTADALGAAVLLADPVTDLFNPNVIRASQGSLFAVSLAVAPAAVARPWLEDRMQVIAAAPASGRPPWDLDLRATTALVVGAEHAGVSSVWRGVPEVTIPTVGVADSLNASVAAAMLLYELRRQRS